MRSSATETESGNIAKRWRELSDQHSWNSMLDPLDIDLRRSRYGEKDFFPNVGLEKENPFKYKVTKFLYATSEVDFEILNEETNWMGYVAVATDEGKSIIGRRDIVIAWRGTQQTMERIKDADILLVKAPEIVGLETHCKVHRGFYSIYKADTQVQSATKLAPETRKYLSSYYYES